MKTKYSSLILWLIFGYVVISALTVLLESLVTGFIHYGLVQEYNLKRFRYYVPAFAAIIYGLSGLVLLVVLRKKHNNISNNQFKVPKLWFTLCLLVAVFLKPLVGYFSNKKLEHLFNDLTQTDYMSSLDFGVIFEVIENSVMISKWALIVIVIVYCMLKLKSNLQTST